MIGKIYMNTCQIKKLLKSDIFLKQNLEVAPHYTTVAILKIVKWYKNYLCTYNKLQYIIYLSVIDCE